MDSLPPDRDQLATRTDVSALSVDLGALEANLRGEMATLDANLRGEMATLDANLRGEMATLDANLRGEMATLGANLRAEMATLGSDLRVEIRDATNGLLRTLFFGMVGTNATLVGLVFAAVRLA